MVIARLAGRPTGPWSTTRPRRELAALQRVVTEVRRFRSDQGLRPAQRVAARLDGLAGAGLAAHEPLIRSLARLDAPGDGLRGHRHARGAPAGSRVELDTRGTIDVAAERARLEKDRAAAEKEVAQAGRSSATRPSSTRRPSTVVAKIRTRLAAAEADLARIDARPLDALP